MAKRVSGGGQRAGRTRGPAEFASGDIAGMDAWGETGFAEVRASLDGAERDALTSYQNWGYKYLNRMLRSDDPMDPWHNRSEIKDMNGLDSVMTRSRTHTEVVAFRGVSPDVRTDDWKVGSTVHDRAFVSTTLNSDIAATMTFRGQGAILRIRVPRGTRAVYLDSTIGKFTDQNNRTGEQELLLGRGARFRVTGRSSMRAKDSGGEEHDFPVIHLDLVDTYT